MARRCGGHDDHARPADRRRLVERRRPRAAPRPRHRRARRRSRERPKERAALWQAFTDAGVVSGDAPQPGETDPAVDAAIGFVARAPGPLAIVPLEDIVGTTEQPNLPGTIDQHPNWRRRFRLPADQILKQPAAERRLRRLNVHAQGARRDAARDPAAAVPQGLHLRRCRSAGALLRRPRHQPSLRLADHHGARRLDARLRRHRSDAGEPRAGRRGGACAGWSMRCGASRWA